MHKLLTLAFTALHILSQASAAPTPQTGAAPASPPSGSTSNNLNFRSDLTDQPVFSRCPVTKSDKSFPAPCTTSNSQNKTANPPSRASPSTQTSTTKA
ncbi:hypothetical protein HDV00_012729 [Rhizophlyctis rosea]|nr:hypothetical protein HDV00_012729 [Rhizophlyctis rosea]